MTTSTSPLSTLNACACCLEAPEHPDYDGLCRECWDYNFDYSE